MIEELKELRADLLRKADALDYCIRMLEAQAQAPSTDAPKPRRQRTDGGTTFTVSSRTEPPVIPNRDGGILMWSDTDDGLHG